MTPEAVFMASWGLIVAAIGIGAGLQMRSHPQSWPKDAWKYEFFWGLAALILTVVYFAVHLFGQD